MKKILFVAFAMLAFTCWAQSQNVSYYHNYYSDYDLRNAVDYQDVLDMLAADGYTIFTQQYATLKEGETAYYYKTFYPNYDYIIVGISNDLNVGDIDLHVYENSYEYSKDIQSDAAAVVHVYSYSQKDMKVVIKNAQSDTPYDASTCRFVIAYK